MNGYKFEGWVAHDAKAVDGHMVREEFEPKTWMEKDVDIRISHCGVGGSDLHTLRSGWGLTNYPCCVGHELVGTVVKLGGEVLHLKVGDRVGVGAQSGSCSRLDCDQRVSGKENLCQNDWIGTYDGIYPDGSKSYDGSSKYCRAAARFVVKIPAGLSSAEAASTMCAGVTTYRDITENGAGPDANMPLSGHLNLLGVGGQFIQIGEPEGELPRVNVFALIGRDIKIGGSIIGSPTKITEVLAFAVSKGIRPRIGQRLMKDANQVIKDRAAGKARLRFVLVNEG